MLHHDDFSVTRKFMRNKRCIYVCVTICVIGDVRVCISLRSAHYAPWIYFWSYTSNPCRGGVEYWMKQEILRKIFKWKLALNMVAYNYFSTQNTHRMNGNIHVILVPHLSFRREIWSTLKGSQTQTIQYFGSCCYYLLNYRQLLAPKIR